MNHHHGITPRSTLSWPARTYLGPMGQIDLCENYSYWTRILDTIYMAQIICLRIVTLN